MPLYEFVCSSCGQHFEKMMRFSEIAQQPECPSCRSVDTRKQISMIASQSSSSGTNVSTSSCGSRGSFS